MSADGEQEADQLIGRALEAGRIAGLLAHLPRDEFGEKHALAVAAAYRRAEAVVVGELQALTTTTD